MLLDKVRQLHIDAMFARNSRLRQTYENIIKIAEDEVRRTFEDKTINVKDEAKKIAIREKIEAAIFTDEHILDIIKEEIKRNQEVGRQPEVNFLTELLPKPAKAKAKETKEETK